MRKFAAAALCCISLAFASTTMAASCDPVSVDEVQKAEDARYAAQMNDDFAAMEKLYADDLVYIHSSALVDTKQSYIESMRSGSVKYKTMRRSEVTVRTFGCVATLTGLGNFDVRVNDKDLAVEIRFHSVWAKRNGKLQFISWQATRTPQK